MNYSIVTTVYNDADRLELFLNEMCSQTILPDEIVIADGGSSDFSREIIEQYRKKVAIPIRYLFGKRLNIAEGFNLAIQSARNEIVMIVAVGNEYSNNCAEELLKILKDPQNDAAFLPVRGKETNNFSRLYTSVIMRGVQGDPSNRGVMMKRHTIEELGYYFEGYKYAGEDMEFFSRFCTHNKIAREAKNAYVLWEVPNNFREFNKQTKDYLIAIMQSCNNIDVLMFYKVVYCYFTCLLCGVVFIQTHIAAIKYLGALMLIIIIICNCIWLMQFGIWGCIFKNYHMYLRLYYTFKEAKYLFNDNKIPKSYRLNRISKSRR